MKLERLYRSHIEINDLAWYIYEDSNGKWNTSIHPVKVRAFEGMGKTFEQLSAMEVLITVVLEIETTKKNNKGFIYKPFGNCFQDEWSADQECEIRNGITETTNEQE